MTLTSGLSIIGFPWARSSSSSLKEKKRRDKKGGTSINRNKKVSEENALALQAEMINDEKEQTETEQDEMINAEIGQAETEQDEIILAEMILAMQNRFFRW